MRPATHTILTILMNILLLYVIYLFFKERKLEGLTQPLDKIDNNNNNNNNTDVLPAIDTNGGSLCSLYASQPQVLNDKCGLLTETNCNVTSCCVWLNGTSCVAGGANGPTFRTSKGKPVEVKSYSHQGITTF